MASRSEGILQQRCLKLRLRRFIQPLSIFDIVRSLSADFRQHFRVITSGPTVTYASFPHDNWKHLNFLTRDRVARIDALTIHQ